MNNNFAACVILYNPKKEDVANILSYINKVEKVYVFDNTEGANNEALFETFKNVSYFWENKNQGLSIRLNQACQKALEDGFEYLLTMDQDSSFLEENLDTYFKDILNFANKESVAVYNLEYDKEYLPVKKDKVTFEKKDHVITSASVMNLKLFPTIGGFDENLFIDGVDIDYCYAALTKGFDNIEFKNNYFRHSLGESVRKGSVTSFYLIKKNVRIHSPVRIYYMYRNMLYLENKYKSVLPEEVKKTVKNYKYHTKKNIKYSTNIFTALSYKRKAINDYRNNKMGKISS